MKAMSQLSTYLDPSLRPYLGPELRPHFILENTKIYGSALMAFVGPCEVKTEHLVDWEDRLNSDFIRAKEMIHFIGEFFGASLAEAIGFQRLFASLVGGVIQQKTGKAIARSGDDLYFDGKKMSVSIVAASTVSCVLHFGLNWDAAGAPVEAIGVGEWMKIEERAAFIQDCLEAARSEWESIRQATVKVRPI
jgi:hypothetical protein